MTVLYKLKKDFLEGILKLNTNWWVEICTDLPPCIYYFGPFENFKEAEASSAGYVEDIENEAAEGIVVNIKRFKPELLTIFDEKEKLS